MLDGCERSVAKIQLTIGQLAVSCDENRVLVYDGIPDFVGGGGGTSKLLVSTCSGSQPKNETYEAKSGYLTVYYRKRNLISSEGFNASFHLLSCPYHCDHDRMHCMQSPASPSEQCVCRQGWTGERDWKINHPDFSAFFFLPLFITPGNVSDSQPQNGLVKTNKVHVPKHDNMHNKSQIKIT